MQIDYNSAKNVKQQVINLNVKTCLMPWRLCSLQLITLSIVVYIYIVNSITQFSNNFYIPLTNVSLLTQNQNGLTACFLNNCLTLTKKYKSSYSKKKNLITASCTELWETDEI